MSTPPGVSAQDAPEADPVIALRGVNKTFDTPSGPVHAVQDITLTVDRGDVFGIIGFSGAGKSTLVRCMNLLERPTSGTVTVSGRELTSLPARDLRAARTKIGMIFQHFNLMPSRTVFDNVNYALKGSGLSRQARAARLEELLDLVGITAKRDAHPGELSGGQKQRVAIARALANHPDVLLCDEATSALDPQTTHAILTLLKRLRDQLGLTVVVITHEMGVVKEICTRVAVMDSGRIVEQGDLFTIFASPRHERTRAFLKTTSRLSKAEELIAADSPVLGLESGEVVVRLTFLKQDVSRPLISEVSRRFDLTVNIIFADVEIINDAPIGGTVVIMSGPPGRIDDALAYLNDHTIATEILKDERRPQ